MSTLNNEDHVYLRPKARFSQFMHFWENLGRRDWDTSRLLLCFFPFKLGVGVSLPPPFKENPPWRTSAALNESGWPWAEGQPGAQDLLKPAV